MTWIVGLDLSLTAPAACMLPVSWKPGDWAAARAYHINPVAPKNDDICGQLERYIAIAEWVCSLVVPRHWSLCSLWIEGYAFNRHGVGAHKLAELGGVVRVAVFEKFGLVPKTVTASAARKIFFGNRKLPKSNVKQAVQLAAYNEAGVPKTWTEDEVDALVVANAGLSLTGATAVVLE